MKLSFILMIFILIAFLIAIGMCAGLIAICALGNFLREDENNENIKKRN